MIVTPKLGKGLGRKPDNPDGRPNPRDLCVSSALLRRDDGAPIGAPLPTVVDTFAGLHLPVYDQGALGSCTANAGVLYRRFLAQKFSQYSAKDEDLSRLFLYFQEREIAGDVYEDSGASVRDAFKTMANLGVCPEVDDPYVAQNFASEVANDSPRQLENAKSYKIGAYHRVPDVNAARQVLASGYAIELGFTVYESFEEIGADGMMPMARVGAPILGGHAVVIRGYDDRNSRFKIQNSWGPEWGDHGCFYMPYEFLRNTELSQFDMWMGHLGKPWRAVA